MVGALRWEVKTSEVLDPQPCRNSGCVSSKEGVWSRQHVGKNHVVALIDSFRSPQYTTLHPPTFVRVPKILKSIGGQFLLRSCHETVVLVLVLLMGIFDRQHLKDLE